MSWDLFKRNALDALHKLNRRSKVYKTHLQGPGTYEIEVVGESNYQMELDHIAGPKSPEGASHFSTATLISEPSNPHDANAIKVVIAGSTVGYLKADRAARTREVALESGYSAIS